MYRRSIYSVIVFVAGTTLTSCGAPWFSNRATDPVISDTVSVGYYGFGTPVYGVLSTTAGRRSIFVEYGKDGNRPTVCAEAPPDAIDAVAHALSAAAQGSAASGVSGGGSFNNALAVSSGLGLYRSQGLQYLRDQSFSLCMMLMQEKITAYQWMKMHDEAAARAERMIDKEMTAIELAAGKQSMVVSAPGLPPPAMATAATTIPVAASPSGSAASGAKPQISPARQTRPVNGSGGASNTNTVNPGSKDATAAAPVGAPAGAGATVTPDPKSPPTH